MKCIGAENSEAMSLSLFPRLYQYLIADMFIDIHTHNETVADGAVAVVCRNICGQNGLPAATSPFISAGLHPWSVDAGFGNYVAALEHSASNSGTLMIGECGLDRIRGGDMQVQEAAFRMQIGLSERIGKPLLIHCVRAFGELLAIKKDMHPQQLWIVHGFRGKAEQAQQLMRHGIELSFGERFNEGALHAAYVCGKMWLETDDSHVLRISDVYDMVAEKLGCGVDALSQMQENKFAEVFGKIRIPDSGRQTSAADIMSLGGEPYF
ncbi:MAG: TatD family hydrolase [Bacteroides sp.]|nr:TatD family hydrolase [Roseburia sp.]MCM1347593.1 TatD family hydrolase [Bacteroides sp.]MCM1420387.1 TatD family hydrolase [Bacteroides sp.]